MPCWKAPTVASMSAKILAATASASPLRHAAPPPAEGTFPPFDSLPATVHSDGDIHLETAWQPEHRGMSPLPSAVPSAFRPVASRRKLRGHSSPPDASSGDIPCHQQLQRRGMSPSAFQRGCKLRGHSPPPAASAKECPLCLSAGQPRVTSALQERDILHLPPCEKWRMSPFPRSAASEPASGAAVVFEVTRGSSHHTCGYFTAITADS